MALDVAWGREALRRALQRATTYRRFSAADVRAILAAGPGVPEPARASQPLPLELPAVAERALSAYALTQLVLPLAPTTGSAVGGVRGPGQGPVGGRA